MVHRRVIEATRRFGDRTAFVDAATGARVRYDALGAQINAAVETLAARGFQPGDVLAIWARNLPGWAAYAFGAMQAGGAVTGIAPAATVPEATAQLADARAAVLVTEPRRLEAARLAAIGAGVREVVALGEHGHGPMPIAEPAMEDLALLPYSSGTTGQPKGVMLTHANLDASLRQLDAALRVGADDRTIAVAPFAHVMGFMLSLLVPLANGATVVTDARFELQRFLAQIQEHRASVLVVPPPVMAALAGHPLVDGYDLSSVEFVACGGAPLSADLQRAVARRMPGAAVGQGYGMTETAVGITLPDRAEGTVAGSVGRAAEGTELRVIAAGGRDAARGAPGELLVRGPQVMRGYRDRPAETRDVLHDGWLRTGDLVRIDPEGNLFVLDRIKELIKVNAHQVAPVKLEALLARHPAVADAAVAGRPDDRRGEVPVAFVVAREAIDEVELVEGVAAQVAPYKRLAAVHVVEELPRTPAGKLLRRRLVAPPGSRGSADREPVG
jgi:acyl-CoA synthetase (AMP-forming)/AMP-acid ligase II